MTVKAVAIPQPGTAGTAQRASLGSLAEGKKRLFRAREAGGKGPEAMKLPFRKNLPPAALCSTFHLHYLTGFQRSPFPDKEKTQEERGRKAGLCSRP